MALITGGTAGIGAAFARQRYVKALCSLDDPGERRAHRDRAPMGEAGAPTAGDRNDRSGRAPVVRAATPPRLPSSQKQKPVAAPAPEAMTSNVRERNADRMTLPLRRLLRRSPGGEHGVRLGALAAAGSARAVGEHPSQALGDGVALAVALALE